MFVVLLGNGIDYWSSGANYGWYSTHNLKSQDDVLGRLICFNWGCQMGQWGSGQTPYPINHLCSEQVVIHALNVIWHVGWVWFALVWYLCQWRAAPLAFGAHQLLVPSIALPGKVMLDYHNDDSLLRLVVFHARDHGWNDSLSLEVCSSRLWELSCWAANDGYGACRQLKCSWCLLLAALQSLTQQNQKNLNASSQWKVKTNTWL